MIIRLNRPQNIGAVQTGGLKLIMNGREVFPQVMTIRYPNGDIETVDPRTGNVTYREFTGNNRRPGG